MKIQKIYLLLMALFFHGTMASAQENKLILIESTIIQNGTKERNSRQVFEYNEQNQLVFDGLYAWFLSADSYSKVESTMVRYNSDGKPKQKLEQVFNESELEERTKVTDYIYFDNGCLAEEEIRTIQAPGSIQDRWRHFYNEQSCQQDSALRYAAFSTGWRAVRKVAFEYSDTGYIEKRYSLSGTSWELTTTIEVIENEKGDPLQITQYNNGADQMRRYEYDVHGNVLTEEYLVTESFRDSFVIRALFRFDYEYNELDKVIHQTKSLTLYDPITGENAIVEEEKTSFEYYCDGLLKTRTEQRTENQFFEYQYFYQQGVDCENSVDTDIELYPNPVSEQLTIKSESLFLKDSEIRIFDVRGALIYREMVEERTAAQDIDVAHLPKGVYFVQIGELPAKRFVKGQSCRYSMLTLVAISIEQMQEPSPSKRNPRKNVFLLGAVSLFTDLSSQMIYPLLPQFLVQLGTSTTLIGVIEGIAEATASLFKTVFGRLSDEMGKRKPFIYLGYGLSTVAKPFLFLATGWIMVLVVKFAERIGKAARGPARDALLSTSVDPKRRGRDFGIQRSMDKIGSVGGPLLAMLVLYYWPENLRLVFLLAVIPALMAILFIPFVVEKQAVTRKADALPAPNFLRNRAFNTFLIANILFTLGNSSNAFLLLKATEEGIDTLYLPLLWVGYNFICSIAAPIFGDLSDRIGRKPVIMLSFACYALIYLGFAYANWPIFIWLLFAAYGIYYGLSAGVFKAYLTELTSEEQRGTAYGLFDTGVGLALLPASILMGFLWDSYGSSTAFVTGAGFAVLGLLVFVAGDWIDRQLKRTWEPPW